MSHKLLVIHPDNSMEIRFDQQITIGRDMFNSLTLHDAGVSRSHAIIYEQDGRIIVKDLNSRNGTYVCGERVAESTLNQGDEIIMGTTVLLLDPPESPGLDARLSERGRQILEKRDARHRIEKPGPATKFTLDDMSNSVDRLFTDHEHTTFFTLENALSLLRAVRDMDKTSDSGQLFETTLSQALAILGGHRGVIMEADEGREHLKACAILSADASETIHISQSILKILLKSEKCVFCPDIARDRHFASMPTKSSRPVHSFVAVPILAREELFGFIYLDSEDSSVAYDFPALRSLYFMGTHLGSLLRGRSTRFPRNTSAISVTSSK